MIMMPEGGLADRRPKADGHPGPGPKVASSWVQVLLHQKLPQCCHVQDWSESGSIRDLQYHEQPGMGHSDACSASGCRCQCLAAAAGCKARSLQRPGLLPVLLASALTGVHRVRLPAWVPAAVHTAAAGPAAWQ